MNSIYRWSLLAILALVLVALASLTRTHATSSPTDTAIVARLDRSMTLTAAPGRADAENIFIVSGIRASAVRILSRSLDMNMGSTSYVASSLGRGQWRVLNAEVPMVGRWGIQVQAWRKGAWISVGQVAYDVPLTGAMHLFGQ